ncbi:restriction endonuclease subunit S [Leptospira wolffii]|uniref:restriction endonuclease subunit S n=1 Tax=Leptospira wolffii TaxID=409998 RepID=UPI00405549A9
MLSFEEGEVEWKTLGEVCYTASGGTPSTTKKEYWENGTIPWLKSESCNNEPVYSADNFITELGLRNSSAKILDKDTTLIALVGATIFKTAYLRFEASTNQNIASIKSKDSLALLDKFIFYYITNLYSELKFKMRNYGMLNLSTLRQFTIPIPSLAEQARIVAILDKFDSLTNSIREGLPREIELRQKQYEYYRELLLSFPKPGVVA